MAEPSWDTRNQAERLMDHLALLRAEMQSAVSGSYSRRRMDRALSSLDSVIEELQGMALISAPAGITRVELPEGVWLYVPDHDRIPRPH